MTKTTTHRRLVAGSVILIFLVSLLAFAGSALAGVAKIWWCHFPPGNPDNVQIIRIGEPATHHHLANHPGDGPVSELGEDCGGPGGPGT